jgi:hypothetical protein
MGRRRDKIGEPFTPIVNRMIDSPAYMRLTNAARTAYTLLKRQCNGHGQTEVKFPYSHARPYMKTDTFAKAIRQLEELGFIEKKQHGGLFRRTNSYRLIEDWRKIK